MIATSLSEKWVDYALTAASAFDSRSVVTLRDDSHFFGLDTWFTLPVASVFVGFAAGFSSWLATHFFTEDSALYEGSIVLIFGTMAILCATATLRSIGQQPQFVFLSALLGYLAVCAPVLMFVWYGGSVPFVERVFNIMIGFVPVVAGAAAGIIVGDLVLRWARWHSRR